MEKLLKILFKVIAFILLPIILFYTALSALPPDRFTFRLWEAFRYKTQTNDLVGPFYNYQKQTRNEVGDLFPYSRSAVLKKVSWETDRFGFRNHPIVDLSKVEIVVGGDSGAVGTSLTQDDTLSELLSRKTGLVAYNLGGVTSDKIPDYLAALHLKPRFFVFVIVERSLGELPGNFSSKKPSLSPANKLAKLAQRVRDNIVFNPFQSYKSKHGIFDSLLRLFIPLSDQDIAPGPYEFKNGFLQGHEVEKIDQDLVVKSAARRLSVYQQFFTGQGIRFVVVSVPNKETIYFDQVPLERQPMTLPMLQTELRTQGVEFIDLFQSFNARYKEAGTLSHHSDDTHWNKTGVSTAADLLCELIRGHR